MSTWIGAFIPALAGLLLVCCPQLVERDALKHGRVRNIGYGLLAIAGIYFLNDLFLMFK